MCVKIYRQISLYGLGSAQLVFYSFWFIFYTKYWLWNVNSENRHIIYLGTSVSKSKPSKHRFKHKKTRNREPENNIWLMAAPLVQNTFFLGKKTWWNNIRFCAKINKYLLYFHSRLNTKSVIYRSKLYYSVSGNVSICTFEISDILQQNWVYRFEAKGGTDPRIWTLVLLRSCLIVYRLSHVFSSIILQNKSQNSVE